jgi:hypothetical protein
MTWLTRIALLASLLLTACHPRDDGPPAVFNPAMGKGTGSAVIVMGFAMSREPSVPLTLFGGPRIAIYPHYTLIWARVTGDHQFTGETRELELCDDMRLLPDTPGACDPLAMHYKVMSFPAGFWVLREMRWQEGRRRRATVFTSSGPGLIIGPVSPPRAGQTVQSDRFAFQVLPGQIAYIGDFTFDPAHLPAQVALSRNDDAARTALAATPNVNGSLVFLPVFSF